MKSDYKIISVGGSIIIPKTGFDTAFLKKFRRFILDRLKRGDKLILVIGGGGTARAYQDAARTVAGLTELELDWVGIRTTQLNALFVRHLFGKEARTQVITDPRRKVQTRKRLIIAAGWKPGCSTDHDTVLLAKTYGVKKIINLSNIEYVYDKDPKKYREAKQLREIDWRSFRRDVVGNTWNAGKNVPFDPIASREAEKLGVTVSMLKGTNLKEVAKALDGRKFKGTVIHP